jgi:hypothetical protein
MTNSTCRVLNYTTWNTFNVEVFIVKSNWLHKKSTNQNIKASRTTKHLPYMGHPCIEVISSIRRTLTGHFVGALLLITAELDFNSPALITAYLVSIRKKGFLHNCIHGNHCVRKCLRQPEGSSLTESIWTGIKTVNIIAACRNTIEASYVRIFMKLRMRYSDWLRAGRPRGRS